MIKKQSLVIFDVMGIIFPFPEGDDIKNGLFPFLENKGYEFSFEQKNHWEKIFYNQASRGKISSIDALEKILPSENKSNLERIEKEYLSSDFFKLDPDLIPIMQKLKNNFFTAILSNDIPNWSHTLRKRFDLKQYFDFAVISGDANMCRKTEKGIYGYLFRKIKQKKLNIEKIYFIDDSLGNLKTAHSFGIHTIYKILKSNDSIDYEPDYQIHNLTEFWKII